MRWTIVIAIIFVAFQILDCHGATISNRLNFFDIDLLRYSVEDKKGNVMISPASIKSTLAMLLEGAEGPTAAEIKMALRVSPEKNDFREELKVFLKALEANNTNVFLQNANALFVSKKLKLKKDYEMVVRRLYDSTINQLDFSDPISSADTINAWVYAKTQGLVPTIVDEAHITPSTALMIVNALYFKAPWKFGFNVKSTHSDCFYNNGVCKNVAMMDVQAEFKYAFVNNLRAHALELPYKGDRYSMVLLVPQDRDAAVALIRDLPFIGLPQISDLMEPTEVILTMPKFDVEYNENLVGALKNMQITSLFSQSANLSNIVELGDYPQLNSIYHSVHMKVDESGTVAAAASSSMLVPLIYDQVQLRIDRPFLFFIRDNKLGIILFEGKIEEPTAFVEPHPPVRGPSHIPQAIPIQRFGDSKSEQKPVTPSNNYTQTTQGLPKFNQPLPDRAKVNQPNQPDYKVEQSHTAVHHPTENQQVAGSVPSVATLSDTTESEPPKTNGVKAWFKSVFG